MGRNERCGGSANGGAECGFQSVPQNDTIKRGTFRELETANCAFLGCSATAIDDVENTYKARYDRSGRRRAYENCSSLGRPWIAYRASDDPGGRLYPPALPN